MHAKNLKAQTAQYAQEVEQKKQQAQKEAVEKEPQEVEAKADEEKRDAEVPEQQAKGKELLLPDQEVCVLCMICRMLDPICMTCANMHVLWRVMVEALGQ